MQSDSKLTVVYLWCESDRPEFLDLFLNAFEHSEYTPVRKPGFYRNLQAARTLAYESVTTPYVCMVDPDDIPDPAVIAQSVQWLEDHPDVAMCTAHDRMINSSGNVICEMPIRPFSYTRLLHTPMEFHSQVVMRTELAVGCLGLLKPHRVYDIDWALRLLMASRYPVHKFQTYGYQLRRRLGSHSKTTPLPGHIQPKVMVDELIRLGLIDHPTSEADRKPRYAPKLM